MQVIRDAAGLTHVERAILVPTMGAIHAGHTALIRRARAEAERAGAPVVVSIFVNPTQFDQRADYERYPVTLEEDLEACQRQGADAAFAPAMEVMYPEGQAIETPALPAVATEPGLEDRMRPGHFAGVCQVVKRLFDLTRPRAAVFGEKDWQQYRVIEAMVRQERLGIDILSVPTMRERDGMALSSRNRFLSESERTRAVSLSRGLLLARRAESAEQAEGVIRAEVAGAGVRVDYAAIRDAETLLPPVRAGVPMRALVAGRIGTSAGEIRLIDNMSWWKA